MGLLVALVALKPEAIARPAAIAASAFSVAIWLALTVVSLVALKGHTFDFGPEPQDQAVYAANHTRYEEQQYVLKTALASLQDNKGPLALKIRMMRASVWFLAVETAGLLATAVLIAHS